MRGRLRQEISKLNPGYGARVMATAIVSTGLFQFGHHALSDVLLVISCAAFALLLAAYTWRFLGYRAQALAQAEQANDELRELAHGILPGVPGPRSGRRRRGADERRQARSSADGPGHGVGRRR